MKKEFTICIVNYFSSVYIYDQLKIFYEFNDPSLFQVVIVDNSRNHYEYLRLSKIIRKYEHFNNIILVKNVYNDKVSSSIQHASGLDIGMSFAKLVESKYFISVDPDCFLLKKDIIPFLKKVLVERNIVAFGVPYALRKQEKIKNYRDFPAAFSMILDLNKVGYEITFRPSSDPQEIVNICRDVGYQIRENYGDMGYVSFNQDNERSDQHFRNLRFSKMLPMKPDFFYFKSELIAIHIGKSSRSSEDVSIGWFLKRISNRVKWYFVRKRIANFCYNFVKDT